MRILNVRPGREIIFRTMNKFIFAVYRLDLVRAWRLGLLQLG